jgi:hypothetical protein
MAEWEEKLDAFLLFKERDLLDHTGKISGCGKIGLTVMN